MTPEPERPAVARGGRFAADGRLAAELAGGKTVRDAAASAGVAERTAFRRLADPEFNARVATLRAESLSRAAAKLAGGMAEAADALRGLLRADREAVRLGACRAMIELAVKVNEAAVLEQRLAALEARTGAG